MGTNFEALDEGVLLVPLDPRCTQVGFHLISVQAVYVCSRSFIEIVQDELETYFNGSNGERGENCRLITKRLEEARYTGR